VEEEELPTTLARQIAGRAGRFGLHEEGHVAGFDDATHEVVRALLREKLPPLPTSDFAVAPTMDHLAAIARITGENSLAQALRRFMRNIDTADAFFQPRIPDEQRERAQWLDTLALSLEDKFILSLVPVSSRVAVLHDAWQRWARNWAKRQPSKLPGPQARETLQEAENHCRLCAAYAWLAYRAHAFFPDIDAALDGMRQASDRVDRMLAAQNRARKNAAPEERRRRKR
jgi:ATP-dependent RNA helicase SUPV3L1/SUV3